MIHYCFTHIRHRHQSAWVSRSMLHGFFFALWNEPSSVIILNGSCCAPTSGSKYGCSCQESTAILPNLFSKQQFPVGQANPLRAASLSLKHIGAGQQHCAQTAIVSIESQVKMHGFTCTYSSNVNQTQKDNYFLHTEPHMI